MPKYLKGDLVICKSSFERRGWFVGKTGEVMKAGYLKGHLLYLVRFEANSDPVWLPSSHLEAKHIRVMNKCTISSCYI